jgi:hypothetical protein
MKNSFLIRTAQEWGLSIFPNSILFIIFLFPIAYFLLMLGILHVDTKLFWRFLKEDGRLEYLQALSYLLAVLAAGGAGWHAKRLGQKFISSFYFLFAIALLLVSMEEISWGQRIIGFNTPELISDLNEQDEFSFHNISIIQNYFLHQAYILIGITSATTWLIIPKRLLFRWKGLISYIVPGPLTVLYFLPVGLFYAYYELARRDLLPKRFGIASQELFETPLALGMLVFALMNLYRLKNVPSWKSEY